MNKLLFRGFLFVSLFHLQTRPADTLPQIRTVFVILMENHVLSELKGNTNAPFLNGVLLPMSSYCLQYYNPRGLHPSLPNYLWLEAGTNFGVRDDNDPSSHHQRTTNHLVAQLKNAGISWKTYQEDIRGLYVPLTVTNNYAPKHNPFVYFDDVTGTNNTKDPYGIAHVRPYPELAADLTNNMVARYNFMTPNQCNDGHTSCPPLNNLIRQGDNWLAREVPKILNSVAYKNNGALFITWDEGENNSDGPIGMIVLSPLARGGGYFNSLPYTHSSTLRTLQIIFGVSPFLGDAANALDLSDLFTTSPVAQCADAFVSAGANCLADASVNDGSFDPEGDAITLRQSPAGPYPPGTNQVTLTVTDSHGAINSCTARVVVVDSLPPAIHCADNLIVTNLHNAWSSVITYPTPVTDNCPGVSPAVCDPPSGSAFEPGVHAVACRAVDVAGNSSQCNFAVTVLPGNQPPVPNLQISPFANFQGNTNLMIISPDSARATVLLDGSASYDVDDAMFSFLWLEETIPFSTNEIVTRVMPVGSHQITLALDDTFPLGTNSQTVTLHVITAAGAAAIVAAILENSCLAKKDQVPLLASLLAASASFERGQNRAGADHLGAFQNKVQAQVRRSNPDLAGQLVQAAQIIIDTLGDSGTEGQKQR